MEPLTSTAAKCGEMDRPTREVAVEPAPLTNLPGFPGLATIRRLSARHLRAVPHPPLPIDIRHLDKVPAMRRLQSAEAAS